MMNDTTKLTVFYDGACPLCSREIGLYRGLHGADDLAFIDISQSAEPVVAPGLSKEDARRRFHVMHPDGRISSGGMAFAHLWTAIPSLNWLGRFFKTKPWSCLLDGAYTIFLPARPFLQRSLGWIFRRP